MIDLTDQAIAGTTTLSTDADVTLTTANGVTDQARQMILNCTGSRAAQRTITAPASSKAYVVINGTTGGFGVKIVGVGPTTGVVVPAGRMAVVAWNGSDFVTLGAVVDLTASGNVTLTALTASTALALDANKQIVSVTNTGTGNNVLATSPILVTPNLGTPSAVTLTNATGLPIDAGTTGTLPAARGGTGQTSYAVGDLLYADTTTSLAKLADVATGNVLISGGIGVAPSWGKVGLATHVSGTLPVANGGTGAVSLTANNVLLGNGTSALQVVAPGTAGNILTSNGTTWQSTAPAASGVTTISFGSTGLTPSTATNGAVSVAGTLAVASGGTGITSFGTGVATALGQNVTGSGSIVLATAPTLGATTFTGGAQTTPVTVTFSATAMTVDCALSNVFATTFTANVTTAPTISNPRNGQTINWFITQDATGSRTMTWPTSFKWPGGLAGTLSTAANSVDLLVATYLSSTGFWYASLSKGFA
jgi:hypothetical protein